MNLRNELEEKGWQSIDTLISLLDEVVKKHAKIVDVDDIEKYINPMMSTIYRHARETRNV